MMATAAATTARCSNTIRLFLLEIALIIFVGVLSLEGSLASNVDSMVAKTSKSIISTTIPVVGKLLR